MKLLIGCPVKNRAWILNEWFDHIYSSCDYANIEPQFCFILGHSSDRTDTIIKNRVSSFGFTERTKTIEAELPKGIDRSWSIERIESMVSARNQLLQFVRLLQPEYFLSLDSDILASKYLVSNLLETMSTHQLKPDAVGGRCYMTRWNSCSSYGKIAEDVDFKRGSDFEGLCQVNVIMAIKIMNEKAYNIDYSFHQQGEDIAWSKNCRNAGLKLMWDGRTISKHVLEKDMLEVVDERVGF